MALLSIIMLYYRWILVLLLSFIVSNKPSEPNALKLHNKLNHKSNSA